MPFSFDTLQRQAARSLIERALFEDGAERDLTSLLACPPEKEAKLFLRARERIILAGGEIIALTYERLGARVKVELLANDGACLEKGAIIARLEGPLRPILTGERTLLNLLQRLCAVATLTASFVNAAGKDGARIVDTRKTLPGFRRLDKYAVLCGGGQNHRLGLSDMIMFKDNHLELSGKSMKELVKEARAKFPNIPIAIEAETKEAALTAASLQPDLLMLDNMPVPLMREICALLKGKVVTEATGGVNLNNIFEVAHCGVDRVSIGAITHSAPAVDLGLDAC